MCGGEGKLGIYSVLRPLRISKSEGILLYHHIQNLEGGLGAERYYLNNLHTLHESFPGVEDWLRGYNGNTVKSSWLNESQPLRPCLQICKKKKRNVDNNFLVRLLRGYIRMFIKTMAWNRLLLAYSFLSSYATWGGGAEGGRSFYRNGVRGYEFINILREGYFLDLGWSSCWQMVGVQLALKIWIW